MEDKMKLITEVKCPSCGFTLRHIPAGTSKETGKEYDEFWVCDNKKDKYGLPCENKFNKWSLFRI